MFKPMLAAKMEDIRRLKFPVLATPKIDGIRCIITAEGPLTRSLKPIPNRHIFETLKDLPHCMDGELTVGPNFQACTSGIMSYDGKPNFTYHVFDHYSYRPYEERVGYLVSYKLAKTLPPYVNLLVPTRCENATELVDFYDKCLAIGAEGVCFRTPDSPYKEGRSTFREQYLVKWKQFISEEANLIGFEELLHNENTPIKNELGLTERSSHQANLKPSGMLGALVVKSTRWPVTFKIGTGFTATQRSEFWARQDKLLGQLVRYKYHNYGIKDAPRCPVFEGFRHEFDL